MRISDWSSDVCSSDLLDLPRLSGLDATRQLRGDPATAGLKIIALTAHAMLEDRMRALDAGCDAYQSKPVDFAALVAALEAVAGRGCGCRRPTSALRGPDVAPHLLRRQRGVEMLAAI